MPLDALSKKPVYGLPPAITVRSEGVGFFPFRRLRVGVAVARELLRAVETDSDQGGRWRLSEKSWETAPASISPRKARGAATRALERADLAQKEFDRRGRQGQSCQGHGAPLNRPWRQAERLWDQAVAAETAWKQAEP